MDEILIEEKKYVSSKRAAKITGYAKDYIGQLCREGRVSARLVGRSWYVLETAIQDHRFGDQKIDQKIQVTPPTPRHLKGSIPPTSTWEAPHYEASPTEVLPSINRLRHPFGGGATSVRSPDIVDIRVTDASVVDMDDKNTVAQRLQDSWRAWFDHVGTNIGEVEPAISEGIEEEVEPTTEEGEDSEVNIPIHVVYEPPPKELLPASTKDFSYRQHDQVGSFEEERGGNKLIARTIKTIGALLALILVALAVIGSGYFDKYILSVSQVGAISGAALYIK